MASSCDRISVHKMKLLGERSVYNGEELKRLKVEEENQNCYHFRHNGPRYKFGSKPLSQKTCSFNNIQRSKTTELDSHSSNSSSQELESDENKIPSEVTIEDKGENLNDSYRRPHPFHPNLYQPNVIQQRKVYNNRQRSLGKKNSEVTERRVHGIMCRFQSRIPKLQININDQVLLNGGPWDTLNHAIWDIYINNIQKEETYIKKLFLWKTIFLFFKESMTNYGLHLVGSTTSGFALEDSDIDICLVMKPVHDEPRTNSIYNLNYLRSMLLEHGLANEAQLIAAKVPILKFKNEESGFEVDLNCNSTVGIHNTRLLYCYAQMDWRVRPLVAIVKIWARHNNVNDAKKFTVSSYSWTLMVIYYLQCGVYPPVLPCLHNLYPEEFNIQKHHTLDVQGEIEGLDDFKSLNNQCLVRTGSRLLVEVCKQAKTPKNDPFQWKYLCIEEPFDLSNTAKSVLDAEIFTHIKRVISASYKELATNKILDNILPLNRI